MADFDLDSVIQDAVASKGRSDNLIPLLTQAWVSERTSPELLPYNETLIDTTNSRLRAQIEMVEETEVIDAKTNFRMVVIQTELERVKFLLRSYLRTRLSKIDKYALHCLRNPEIMTRLSSLERQYAEKHQGLLERHYQLTFLKDFPDSGNLRKLDDGAAAGLSMIDTPDLKSSVFCKVIRPIEESIRLGPEKIDLEVGNIALLRYEAIRQYIYDVCEPLQV